MYENTKSEINHVITQQEYLKFVLGANWTLEGAPQTMAEQPAKDVVSVPRSDSPEAAPQAPPAGSAWVEEFVICGAFHCKDVPAASEAVLIDAPIHVAKEPRSPSFSVMGLVTAPTGQAPPEALTMDKLFWLARFECVEAWAGPEHKEREGNAEFVKKFNSTGMSGNVLEDMNGSYTGKMWHLERDGCSKTEPVYMIKVLLTAKDAAAAERLISVTFEEGAAMFAADEGMLRYSVLPTGEVGMMGPLPKDDVTVTYLQASVIEPNAASNPGANPNPKPIK